jgi:DNA polymerase-3 subunit beta
MPFLSLSQKQLASVLGVCSQISLKKSEVEAFTFTKITLTKDSVSVSALNSGAFYTTILEPQNLDLNQDEFSFLIKTEIFSGAINLITDELVGLDINPEKHTLVVQGSKAKHTLRIDTDRLTDFVEPKPTSDLQATLEVSSDDFIKAVNASLVSVGQAKNVYEPKFLNVCFTPKIEEKKLYVVSTDRYRVSKTCIDAEITNVAAKLETETVNYLILPKNLQLFVALSHTNKVVKVNFYEDFSLLEVDKSKLMVRFGDGVYPDYEKIIPQSFTCSFLVETKELLAGLKQVYLSARSNAVNKSIILDIEPETNKITFSSSSEDGYASESAINMTNYQGTMEAWKQSFNADYLIEYINTVENATIFWEANPGKPSVLSPLNEKEKQVYLVSGLK